MKLKSIAAAVAVMAACLIVCAEDLPLEHFFKDPTFRRVRISPDGTKLAVLVRFEDYMDLSVIDLADGNKPTRITAEKQDISSYHWVNDERLIYMMNSATDTEYERTGGLYAVNTNGKRFTALFLPPGGDSTREAGNIAIPRYLGPSPKDDKHILVALGERSRDYPDVYEVNAYSGRKKRILVNEMNARYYQTDVNDEVRFAFQTELVGETIVHFLHPETDKWEVLTVLPETDADWLPLDFSPDRDTFLVQTDLERDKSAIVRFNWKEKTSEVVYEDPEYDVDPTSLIYELKKQDACVGLYYEADKPKAVYFDKQHEQLQHMIDQALPKTFNEFIDIDDNSTRLLVASSSDRQMPVYYMLDLKTFQLSELAQIAPWMDADDFTEKKPVAFEASDGKTVHGYLVLPEGYTPGNPVPLIVNPHGGPWARDTWRMQWWLDGEQHYFANRGFAVLQVNFRGSTGYGKSFFDDHKQNIERMYLDTVEAALWAIDAGYAHPDQVAIAGASWGGYKTMLCMVKRPDLFKFGINLFGVVDLHEAVLTYLEWNRPEAYDYWSEKFYDPKDAEGRQYYEQWSPITYIDQIEGPVFIYHGVRDANVDIEQSRMLVSALKKMDHPYVRVFDADEMHSLENEELRFEVYQKIDDFIMPFRKEWGIAD